MQNRDLFVIADDYGIGPEVSRAIRELMREELVTGTVLMINSPYAEKDILLWQKMGCPGEMGWHPCLTMDRPVARHSQVPSIVDAAGFLLPLGQWMARLSLGRIRYRDVVTELDAQYRRFREVVGYPPPLINGHKHIHVFPLITEALIEVLHRHNHRPYIRQVREAPRSLRGVPGARVKRLFLSTLGNWAARQFYRHGFPGNDYLIGITDPSWVNEDDFLNSWLRHVPGKAVELVVHPGYYDATLIGRDCSAIDGQLERRVAEISRLRDPSFRETCRLLGFRRRSVTHWLTPLLRKNRHAA